MNKVIEVNDLGAASLYLRIWIDRDCPACKLWLFQKHVVMDLLTTYNLLKAHPSSVPLRHKLHALLEPLLNSLSDILNSEIKVHYQCLISSLLYLMLCTRPDIAYAAMTLGQFNANLSCTHLLAAKGVLCYFLGTPDFTLEYTSLSTTHWSFSLSSSSVKLCIY